MRYDRTRALGPTVPGAGARILDDDRAVITATADDGAYGDDGVGRPDAQDVTAGRAFVGGAPGAGGRPVDMVVIGSGTSVALGVRLPGGPLGSLHGGLAPARG